jgi:hypothetical protein
MLPADPSTPCLLPLVLVLLSYGVYVLLLRRSLFAADSAHPADSAPTPVSPQIALQGLPKWTGPLPPRVGPCVVQNPSGLWVAYCLGADGACVWIGGTAHKHEVEARVEAEIMHAWLHRKETKVNKNG